MCARVGTRTGAMAGTGISGKTGSGSGERKRAPHQEQ